MTKVKLPKRYEWLKKEPGPRLLLEALSLYGTLEKPGPASNGDIINWATEVGGTVADIYKADSIPWCGLFMAVVARRANWDAPKNPLWALSWSSFGTPTKTPQLGDILTFTRKGGGHVALYVGEDQTAYHCLGGNQEDSVNITRIAKGRLYTGCVPKWRVAEPPNRRRIHLSPTGSLSNNEA